MPLILMRRSASHQSRIVPVARRDYTKPASGAVLTSCGASDDLDRKGTWLGSSVTMDNQMNCGALAGASIALVGMVWCRDTEG